MTYANAASAYRQHAILTASREKLVKMLYDGAIRHMEQSRAALADPATRRGSAAGVALSRAFAIVGELRSTLDHEKGGAIANDLGRLYDFTLDQVAQANMTRETTHVENGLRVMRTLKEGWDAIIPG